MSDAWIALLAAVIVGILSLCGTVYTSKKSAEAMDVKLQVSLAEMRKDIQSLRDETKRHNGVIERTYKLETSVARLEDEDKRQNHRIEELEHAAAREVS